MTEETTPDRLITAQDVMAILSVCRSTVWRLQKRHADFPKPVILSGMTRWWESEIISWAKLQARKGI